MALSMLPLNEIYSRTISYAYTFIVLHWPCLDRYNVYCCSVTVLLSYANSRSIEKNVCLTVDDQEHWFACGQIIQLGKLHLMLANQLFDLFETAMNECNKCVR